MILVYSHSATPRLQYVTDFLSGYYGLPFKLVPDEKRYTEAQASCKINYSYHRITEDEIWIHPHPLLFESAIHPIKTECFEHKGYTVFFKAEGDAGFDLLAAIFYLLSRYEEYLPHPKDSYGRFSHQASLAFKAGFLHRPLVNIWLEDFRKLLAAKETDLAKPAQQFSFIPTYDIDIAWSFKNKGFKRNAGPLLRLFTAGRWRSMAHRIKVLRGRAADPYDAYGWMDALHSGYSLHPVYFFLVAAQNGKYDKNIDPQHPAFISLVKELSARYATGLHPSWASGDQPLLLHREKKTLQDITELPVHSSRQHYIRFGLPQTYQRLLAAGIKADYSMGYGSVNGFRASVATPFFWYDLKNDEKTALVLHPFCFMEANSYYEQGQTAEESFTELMNYYREVKKVDGTLCTIWHNSFLGTDPLYEGWRDMYEKSIRHILGKDFPTD